MLKMLPRQKQNTNLNQKTVEARHSHLLGQASHPVFFVGQIGNITHVNLKASQSFGYTYEELCQISLFDINDSNFEDFLLTTQQLQVDKPLIQENKYKRKDGSTFPAEVKINKLDSGEFLVIVKDLSAYKEVEGELQTLISAMPDLMIVFDREGHYLKVISNEQNKLYSETKTRIGKNIYEFANKETADGIVNNIRQCLDTGNIATYEYESVTNGQTAWFSARISKLTSKSVMFVTRSITTYKIAETAIAESEVRYRAFVENAPEAIIVFDFKTYEIVDVNEKAARFFDYKPRALLKLTLAHISSPTKSSANSANFAKIAQNIRKGEALLECFFYTSEGDKIASELRLSYMPSSLRSLVRCSIVDIRERKKQEKALKMYAHYAELTTNISSMFISLSAQELDDGIRQALAEIGKQIRVEHTLLFLFDEGSAFKCIYEWNKEGFSSLELQNNLSGLAIKRILEGKIVNVSNIEELGDKYSIDKQFWRKQNLKSFLGLPFASGKGVTGFLAFMSVWEHNWSAREILSLKTIGAIFANAIERQKAESELEEYRNHLEELVQKRTDELLQALENLKSAQHELVQSEKMVALGQLVAGIAHEVNTPLGAIRAAIENITRAFKETTKALPNLLPRLDAGEQKLFFELVDASLQNNEQLTSRAERKLRRNLQNELREKGITEADDFAERLVSMGITDMVRLEPYLPLLNSKDNRAILQAASHLVSQQLHSSTISTATERASKVVFALKRYTYQGYGDEKTLANICESIDMVLTLYNNQIKQGVEVVKHYQDIADILCYPDELNQVWTNLVHNALQAMDYKGKLELTVNKEGDYIITSIKDNGKGIPEEIKPRIFEPFFTSKPLGEGSGLGLNIVKKIIEKHSGEISVTSKPNDTTFLVKLPI